MIDGVLQRGVVIHLPRIPDVGETFEKVGGPTYRVAAVGATASGVPVLRLKAIANG